MLHFSQSAKTWGLPLIAFNFGILKTQVTEMRGTYHSQHSEYVRWENKFSVANKWCIRYFWLFYLCIFLKSKAHCTFFHTFFYSPWMKPFWVYAPFQGYLHILRFPKIGNRIAKWGWHSWYFMFWNWIEFQKQYSYMHNKGYGHKIWTFAIPERCY